MKIKVKTNSREQSIEKISDDEYRVNLTSRPVKGEANKELLKLLKKYFGREVEIASGATSKIKFIKFNKYE